MEQRKCLQLKEKALDVAREYYNVVGKEAIQRGLPDYADRIAYGLVGEGSECYGYDDLISTDHDYGPSFCMWLTHEDYEKVGMKAQEIYLSLPADFKGYAPRVNRMMAGDRVGALDMDAFYGNFLGRPDAPEKLTDWLCLPEHYLAVACNGEVFEDKLGKFTEIREKLLAYYPADVRKKKLAAKVLKMAHAGQANYSRMMRRGDVVAAAHAVDEFIENAIAVIYLLNKRYRPYYKWRFRGLMDLEILSDCVPLIEELASIGNTADAWADDLVVLDFARINRADRRVDLMETICEKVAMELRKQRLCYCGEDYLEPYAYAIQQTIRDPQLKGLHILFAGDF